MVMLFSFFSYSQTALASAVVVKVMLSDWQAHLNGHTVSALLKDDVPEFVRLVGVRFVFANPFLLTVAVFLNVLHRHLSLPCSSISHAVSL